MYPSKLRLWTPLENGFLISGLVKFKLFHLIAQTFLLLLI